MVNTLTTKLMASDEASPVRENHMAQITQTSMGDSPGPVVLILGQYHADNTHYLRLL